MTQYRCTYLFTVVLGGLLDRFKYALVHVPDHLLTVGELHKLLAQLAAALLV